MNPVETQMHVGESSTDLKDALGSIKSTALKVTPKLLKSSLGSVVIQETQQIVDSALEKARPDIQKLILDSVGPSIQNLIRESVVATLKNVNQNVVQLLGGAEMPAKKTRTPRIAKDETKTVKRGPGRPPKSATAKTAATNGNTKVQRKRTEVEPTRGRFQMFDIKELSAPFSDPSGRTFVACKYADGTKRVYSFATIVKNRDPLSRILGPATLKRVIGKL